MKRGILEVFLVDAHGITHTNFIGDYKMTKLTFFMYVIYQTEIFIFEYMVAGSPVYYVLLQCGTKEYRSKMSKGSSFVTLVVLLCFCVKRIWKKKTFLVLLWKQVIMTMHCGTKSLFSISLCPNGRSWLTLNLKSWTKSSSKMVDLLVKPCI